MLFIENKCLSCRWYSYDAEVNFSIVSAINFKKHLLKNYNSGIILNYVNDAVAGVVCAKLNKE